VNEGEQQQLHAARQTSTDRGLTTLPSPLHVPEVRLGASTCSRHWRRDRIILAAAIPARIGVKG
jgi:hypothetical protein